MTVVNYSVQDIISPERRVFVGTEWFKQVMRDDELLIASAGYGAGHALVHLLKAVDADELWGVSVLLVLGLAWWLVGRCRATKNKT